VKREQKHFMLSPTVLKALRESSGYSIEEVAKGLGVSVETIAQAEETGFALSLAQIEKLASVYKRPLVAFFSDSIGGLPTLVDYRVNREKRLSPHVYIAQRRARYLAEKIKELSDRRTQIPRFPAKMVPEALARDFRAKLGVPVLKRLAPHKLLSEYKRLLEDRLTVLIIEYPFKADDVRGFSIFSDVCAIVLNEEDKPSIKLFSLFHEVCHLLQKTGGICSLELEGEGETESYCNRFAAEFLVPLDDLKKELKRFERVDEEVAGRLSETYGVSKQVIMLRLLWARHIDAARYAQFKSALQGLVQSGFGRRSWEKTYLNRAGNLAIQEVRRAYIHGTISFHEAVGILGLKAKYAEKVLAEP
jgi:Zn-dependent peptidase ImmA (M78 family)